jgi:ribosomal protein S27E
MTSLKYPYINYQESNITFKKCKECKNNTCQLLYDHHHDQHFSYTCGKVIIQSNTYEAEYYTDPHYWTKQYQRRQQIKQLKKIITTLKELKKKKLTINLKTMTIIIHHTLNEDHKYLIQRSCRDTDFELNPYENNNYIIQKKKITGANKK